MTSAPGDKRLFVVEQEGTIRTVSKGKVAARPYADLRRFVTVRRRAGPALGGVLAEVRDATASSTSTSRTRRATRSIWELHARKGAASVRPGHRQLLEIPDTEANHNGGQLAVRARRDALHRRSATAAAAAISTASTATARTRTSCSASSLRIDVDTRTDGQPYGIPKDNPFVGQAGWRARDLGARPAQPVALLVRPRERRPLDRRRRPERVGGGRPRQARPSAASTSAGTATRAGTTSPAARRSPAGSCAGPVAEYSHARRLQHHGRLRLPRAEDRRASAAATSTPTTARARCGRSATSGGAPRDVSSVVSDAGAKSIVSFGRTDPACCTCARPREQLYRFVCALVAALGCGAALAPSARARRRARRGGRGRRHGERAAARSSSTAGS